MRTERSNLSFWVQWVAATALGELAGLGIAAAVGSSVIRAFGEPATPGYAEVFAGLAVLLGALQGGLVGAVQAGVLRRRLKGLHGWVLATALGGSLAWAMGVVPGILIGLYLPPLRSGPGVPDWLQLLLAMPAGVLAGAILSFPQWRVLRHYLAHAGWWLTANALAWALGMPLVFVAAGVGWDGGTLLSALMVIGGLAAAGAVVGAVSGAYLVWLSDRLPRRLEHRARTREWRGLRQPPRSGTDPAG